MALLAVMTGCSGQYKGMPREEVLAYQTNATYGGLHTLAVAYAEAINAAVKEDTLHPGMYADYGVALALMGHRGTACRMLNAEVRTFPESRGMVRRIKMHLMPDMLEDTLAPLRDTADMGQLWGWAYDSLTALMPLPGVASVIDSTDTAWLRRQTPVDSLPVEIRLTANQKREMLEEQQMAAQRARKAYADSVAAAKQAKVDARKQAKVEKEKVKKQKEKDKSKAAKQKKRLEKQKQKEREQAAAEKKKAQERQAAERKKEQQQKAAMKKQAEREKQLQDKQKQKERERLAAEKKKQKEQEALEKKKQKEQEAAEKKAQGKQKKGGEE